MGEELQIMSEIPFDAQELANMAGYGGMYKKSKELKKLGEAKKNDIKRLMNRVDSVGKSKPLTA